ncbi:MAG: glycosyltransferase family 39 protein [bacterium]
MNLAVGFTARRIVSRFYNELAPAASLTATAAIFCGEIVAVTAALGFCGILTRLSVLGSVIFIAAVCFCFSGFGRNELRPYTPHSALFFFLLLYAAIAAWAVAAPPPAGGDGFIYHLYFPAQWLKHHAIEIIPLPFGASAASYYPLNSETLFLWLMLPFHEDFLTNTLQIPFLLLCGALVYELSRRTCAHRDAPLLAAATALLIPAAIQQAVVARVDVIFSAWFLAAILFLLEWNDRRKTKYLILAGIASGLFIGTKSISLLYGTLIFLPFLFVAGKQRIKERLKSLFVFAALALAFGGFWYVRNWIATGNPVYPLRVEIAGITVFHGAYTRGAMQVFHTDDPVEIIRIFDFFLGSGLGIFLAFCAAIAIFVSSGAKFSLRKNCLVMLPFALILLFWFANPHNNLTNGRFLFPVFFLACLYPGWVAERTGKLGAVILKIVLFLALIQSTLQHDHLVRIVRDIFTTIIGTNSGLLLEARAAIMIFFIGTIASAALWMYQCKVQSAKCKVQIFNFLLILIILFISFFFAWNYHRENKYQWYAAFDEGKGWGMINAHGGQSARIAVCGGERAYGLFGIGLRHDVFYVNVDEHADWNFHDYHLKVPENRLSESNIERPQFHRLYPDYDAWLRNLKTKKADFLFCATLDPISRQFMLATPDGFPVEYRWAYENPDSFKEIYKNNGVHIYRIK